MRCTYLLIDFFTLLFPFLLSFHPKSRFYKIWSRFFPAVFITAVIFILWDFYFTRAGFWGFNNRYVFGVYLYNLPIEEVLFFFCIPYACVFTYSLFGPENKFQLSKIPEQICVAVLTGVYLLIAAINYHHPYTFAAFILLTILHFIAYFVFKIQWLPKFYVVYSVLLIPFIIVNGLLTGTLLAAPIVWYRHDAIMGFRLLTIPIEDIFYGMDLIIINLLFFNYRKDNQKKLIPDAS